MKPHTPPAPQPAPAAVAPPYGDDEAPKRAIADAIWTEIHWLFPHDRTVTVTVRGDDIAVEFDPVAPAAPPTSH